MATKIQAGDKAPEVAATDQNGQERSLSSLQGKNVVLYFYPKDDTPGCTTEACAFQDNLSRLRDHDTEVLGVSVDTVESHKRFAKKYGLEFPLLADPGQRIVSAFGVPVSGGTAARTTFLIDDRGVVRKVWEDVDPNLHVKEIEQEIRSSMQRA